MKTYYEDKNGEFAILNSKYSEFYDEEQREVIEDARKELGNVLKENEDKIMEMLASIAEYGAEEQEDDENEEK